MKQKVLDIINTQFAHWSSKENFYCSKGCTECCTQNVTMTAIEGLKILDFCLENNRDTWIAQKLSQKITVRPPTQTTNEYIASCIEGQEVEQDITNTNPKCPFLENNICTIYPVRPFSCRCFVSQQPCKQHGSALVPDYYLSASLAIMQIIEHLGQNEYWGNMMGVLLSLCDRSSCKKILNNLEDPAQVILARLQTLKAKPIPGFLIPEEDKNKVSPLLDAIFSEKIGERTLEQMLNGQ